MVLRGKSDIHEAMVASCAVTFQLQEVLRADCKSPHKLPPDKATLTVQKVRIC